MKQFKLVDSLNSIKQIRHINACNWYMRGMPKKRLDKKIGKEHTGIKVITVITKQEIWVKG